MLNNNYFPALSSFFSPSNFGAAVTYIACACHTASLLTWLEAKHFPVITGSKGWTGCFVPGTIHIFPHLIFTKPEHKPYFLLGLFLLDIRLCRLYVRTKKLQWAIHSSFTFSPASSSKRTACPLFTLTLLVPQSNSFWGKRWALCSGPAAHPSQSSWMKLVWRRGGHPLYHTPDPTFTGIHSNISRQGETNFDSTCTTVNYEKFPPQIILPTQVPK